MIHTAGVATNNEGVDDIILQQNALQSAIGYSLDLFGQTTYESAVACGYDQNAQRAAWKALCKQVHPNSVHQLCKTHKVPEQMKPAVTAMLTVAFTTLSEAHKYVLGWLDSKGAGVVRTSVTDAGIPCTGDAKRPIDEVDLNSDEDHEDTKPQPYCRKHRRRANTSDFQVAEGEAGSAGAAEPESECERGSLDPDGDSDQQNSFNQCQ